MTSEGVHACLQAELALAQAVKERDAALAEAAKWKANHDNLLKRQRDEAEARIAELDGTGLVDIITKQQFRAAIAQVKEAKGDNTSPRYR